MSRAGLAEALGNIAHGAPDGCIRLEVTEKQVRRVLRTITSSDLDAAMILEQATSKSAQPLVVDRWLCRYNQWRGTFLLERIVEPGTIGRLVEIQAQTIHAEIVGELASLSPTQYEQFVIQFFRAIPSVTEVSETAITGDGGVDLQGSLCDEFGGVHAFLGQVKKWGARVGASEARDFVGRLSSEPKNAMGFFIASSGVTPAAGQFLEESRFPITVWSEDQLVEQMIERQIGTMTEQFQVMTMDGEFWSEIRDFHA